MRKKNGIRQKVSRSSSGGKEERPELFFGLVGAVGADLDAVNRALISSLSDVNYDTQTISLSGLLREFKKWKDLPIEPLDDHIQTHMDAGDTLRKIAGSGDALAVLAIQEIRNERFDVMGASDKPIPRRAYILRSLKNPKEVRTLRRVYGPASWIIAAYSPRETRTRNLADRIAKSHHSSNLEHYMPRAQMFVEHDEFDVGNKFGQDVRETFPLSDVFINASDPDGAVEAVKRFVMALFRYPFHTPTRDENGMFHAKAAALRSSSLARQVGAVVSTKDGDIIAVGCNDVPKSGGGLYWPDTHDHRDFRLGHDESDRLKKDVLADALDQLRAAGWLAKSIEEMDQNAIIEAALPIMKGAKLMDLIEFGRTVHAEMTALLNAAHRGVPVRDCTLYTTTFPCHDCARHIVASGIKQVVYIEPYPKSLAGQLHQDSIVVDNPEAPGDHVSFKPFVGIAPRRYMNLFSMLRRKDNIGKIVSWEKSNAYPRYPGSPPTYMTNEGIEVAILTKVIGSELEVLNESKIGGVPKKGSPKSKKAI